MFLFNKIKLFILTTIISFSCVSTNVYSTTIYVASNKQEGNTLVGFSDSGEKNGKFKKIGEFATGGKGTGDLEIPALKKDSTHPLANGDDPLISAYGVHATSDGKHVLTVNAGDSTISLFKVKMDKTLKLINITNAGDKFPISIGTYGNLVAVASVGIDNNHGSISTYRINKNGNLVAVPNSHRDLNARPSTIGFTSNGKYVVVNELVTGKIHTFRLDGFSLSDVPVSTINSPRSKDRFQAVPVGFDMYGNGSSDFLFMSEARFLTPEFSLREEANVVPQSPKYSWQTGSLSSYKIDSNGVISLINGDILTGKEVEGGEIANCWVVLSPNNKFLWAANALSSSISSFKVQKNGLITLKNVTAFKSEGESLFFSDLGITNDGEKLFQLVGNMGEILIFEILNNGDLKLDQTLKGLPKLGSYGLLVLE